MTGARENRTEDLAGRVALVTGGDRGIGAAIARDLARAGARVAVNYLGDDTLAQQVVAGITSTGGVAQAFSADVSDEDAVAALFDEIRRVFGPVGTLANNAGVWRFGPIVDVSLEDYHRHFDTNVLGNVLCSRAFARQPEADGGTIINLTSAGIGPTGPGTSLYIATKAAIVALTRVLAVELAPRGVRVNAIAAGLVDTPGTRDSGCVGSSAAESYVEEKIPLGRIGQSDDIASAATFLASPVAGLITGQVLFSDGGASLL